VLAPNLVVLHLERLQLIGHAREGADILTELLGGLARFVGRLERRQKVVLYRRDNGLEGCGRNIAVVGIPDDLPGIDQIVGDSERTRA
jgi:hypothetical protein